MPNEGNRTDTGVQEQNGAGQGGNEGVVDQSKRDFLKGVGKFIVAGTVGPAVFSALTACSGEIETKNEVEVKLHPLVPIAWGDDIVRGVELPSDGRPVGTFCIGKDEYKFGIGYEGYSEIVNPKSGELTNLAPSNAPEVYPSQVASYVSIVKLPEGCSKRVGVYPFVWTNNGFPSREVTLDGKKVYAAIPIVTVMEGQGIRTKGEKDENGKLVTTPAPLPIKQGEGVLENFNEGYLSFVLCEVKPGSRGDGTLFFDVIGVVENRYPDSSILADADDPNLPLVLSSLGAS